MISARNPAWTKRTGSHAEQHVLQFLDAESDEPDGDDLSWLHDADRTVRPKVPHPTEHGGWRRYEWPDGSALSVAWSSEWNFGVHRDHLEEARAAIAKRKARHTQAAEVAWPDTDPALCRPPTASGPAPHYSYAWTPCDENGEVDGDDDDDELFHSAASEEAADDELGSFSWGGFVRRTAPDGTHEYDWGGGYRATLVEAIAAVLGLGDVDDDEEDLEDEELDDEKLRELCENPNDSPARWFRVAGFGLSGAPARSAKNAWASYELAGRREYGYKACDQGTSRARHSAGLVAGTTWRAVESADVSEVSGTCRRGMWWRCRAT